MRFAWTATLSLVAAALLIASLTGTAVAQAPLSFSQIFANYAAGDYDVVVRELQTQRDYDRIERDLERTRDGWKKAGWRRTQAVFLLEIVAVAYRGQWRNRADLLEMARDFVLARPTVPGTSPEDDAFETLWHRAALTMLIARLDALAVDRYLTETAMRIGDTPQATASGPRLVEPRLALIHAQALEQRLIPGDIWTTRLVLSGGRPIFTMSSEGPGAALGDVRERFSAARDCEPCREEALVRFANVLLRLNRPAEALQALEGPEVLHADRVLHYWRALIRGRALDALDRADEAIAAYDGARALFPKAQSPLVALAVLHFRQGRLDEAARYQDALRQLPADAPDPWWSYWHADGRFFPALLTALREAAR